MHVAESTNDKHLPYPSFSDNLLRHTANKGVNRVFGLGNFIWYSSNLWKWCFFVLKLYLDPMLSSYIALFCQIQTGTRFSRVILTVTTFIFCIFPSLLLLHFQFTVCVSISTFSLSICIFRSSSLCSLGMPQYFIFIKRKKSHDILDSLNVTCDWLSHQAPSSLLDALEQHLASLEGKKVKDSTAASRYVEFWYIYFFKCKNSRAQHLAV